jgi:hypothetical protein
MAVNQIQFAQRMQPKKDALDKVLQGLQIAEAAFGIPVKYEQFRSQRADARLKEDEQAGIITDAQIMKSGGYSVPQSGLMPERQGASLLPAKVRRGDEVVDVMVGNREADRNFFADQKGLRSEYETHQLTKETNNSLLAAEKALAALNKGGPSGMHHIAAVKSFFKTIESNSAVNEGEFKTAANAAGWMDKVNNLKSLFDGGSAILGPGARDAMKRAIADIVDAQLSVQDVLDDRYTEMANERAFKAKNIVTGFWAQDDSPIRPLKRPEQMDQEKWDKLSHVGRRQAMRIAEAAMARNNKKHRTPKSLGSDEE